MPLKLDADHPDFVSHIDHWCVCRRPDHLVVDKADGKAYYECQKCGGLHVARLVEPQSLDEAF